MVDPDKQMARGPTQEGWANLSIGEPHFLQHHIAALIDFREIRGWEGYPYHGGQPELLRTLRNKNPGKYVVVANGAKQAIAAAIYAIDRSDVHHSVPHWPSFPTIAKMGGRVWTMDQYSPDTTRILSSPNNPDGSQWMGGEICDILDCAYAHSVYGWNRIIPDHLIGVWSAAKLFGLSGERIGWALTEDEILADRMADYVEKTTSGVNTVAQARLDRILQMNNGCLAAGYMNARDDLLANFKCFEEHVAPHCDYYSFADREPVGMFAWFRVADQKKFQAALDRAKVCLVDGRACGMEEDGWYRMSLGHTVEVTRAALSRLEKELQNG